MEKAKVKVSFIEGFKEMAKGMDPKEVIKLKEKTKEVVKEREKVKKLMKVHIMNNDFKTFIKTLNITRKKLKENVKNGLEKGDFKQLEEDSLNLVKVCQFLDNVWEYVVEKLKPDDRDIPIMFSEVIQTLKINQSLIKKFLEGEKQKGELNFDSDKVLNDLIDVIQKMEYLKNKISEHQIKLGTG